ncbi:MAG TPA: hypothetical protein PLR44_00820 [Thermomicrobiales bacterium]|nr:hypothetical protein [Thermomicrobiales bacterium]
MSEAPSIDSPDDASRPLVMSELTITQAHELERYYELKNRSEWDQRTRDYGWSSEESQRVWGWFENRAGTRRSFNRDL